MRALLPPTILDRSKRPLRALASAMVRLLPDSVKGYLFFATSQSMSEQRLFLMERNVGLCSIRLSLRRLQQMGFAPSTIVDCGAYHGDWTRLIKSIFPSASVLMIEAQPALASGLQAFASGYAGSVTLQSCLLGPEAKSQVPFHTIETGSSVLGERSHAPRGLVHLDQRTLDDVVDATLGKVDLLKIDTQGYEIEVMRGGSRALASAEVVLLEVSVIEINPGAPSLASMVQFMLERGFVTFDICELHRRPLDNALAQVDIIFVRESSALRSHQFWE